LLGERAGTPALLLFDFDGVVADSEIIAIQTEADYLTAIGHPTSFDEAMHMFMGKNHTDTVAAMERYIGRKLPADYETTHRDLIRARMRRDVAPVPGIAAFLDAHTHILKCVASSSSTAWLDHCVDKFGLRPHFGDKLFSATLVANGKPAPDIYWHAARAMGAADVETLVIEDSPTGVRGGVAAGMFVVGFLGGSHIRPGHADKLRAAGAHAIAEDFAEVAAIVAKTRIGRGAG
jgi:HAD superfamily hydrolase (TIGR01509 family)